MKQLREDIAELFYEMQLRNVDYTRTQDLSFGKPKGIPYRLTPKAYSYLLNRSKTGRFYWPTGKDEVVWQFNFSQRRHEAITYRRAYKVWVCSGKKGPAPNPALSMLPRDIKCIQSEIERLYGQK